MSIQVEFWHWWVLALCFIVFEGMLRTGIYGALTIAAGILGAIVMQEPFMPIFLQLGAFGTLTLTFLMMFNSFMRRRKLANPEEDLVEPHSMIGVEFELTSAIQNGFGEVIVDKQHWSIKGPRIKSGTLVRVLQLDGDMLLVMPVSIINEHQQEKNQSLK